MMGGCSEKESKHTILEKFDFLQYYPSNIGTFQEFTTYSPETDEVLITRKHLNSIEHIEVLEDGTEVYLHNYDSEYFFSLDPEFIIDNSLSLTISENAVIEFNDIGKSAILKKLDTWSRDNETKITIRNTNTSITTPAGKFTECIELLRQTLPDKNGDKFENEMIDYICPGLGKVATYYKLPDMKKFEVFEEMTFLSIPEQESVGEQFIIDSIVGGNTDLDTVDENPLTSLTSSSLPSTTNKVSTLDFYGYRDRVNKYSLESIGYAILQNPINFQEDDPGILLEFDGGISILVEKESYLVKEISVNHKSAISQESYIYTRDLIMGIDETISPEQADEIIYPIEDNTVQLGEFEMGVEVSDRDFIFSAVVR